jgi:hypothetical protein
LRQPRCAEAGDLHVEGGARRLLAAGEQQGAQDRILLERRRRGASTRLHAALIGGIEEIEGVGKAGEEMRASDLDVGFRQRSTGRLAPALEITKDHLGNRTADCRAMVRTA